MKAKITIIAFISIFFVSHITYGQQSKTYDSNTTIEEQLNFVIDESSTWEQYKMVRSTWMNTLQRNTLDTIILKKQEITQLKDSLQIKHENTATLQNQLEETNHALQQLTRERDSFSFMGITMHKSLFISMIVLFIIIVLAIAGFVFLLFQRGNMVSRKTKKELAELKDEFENYRQESRKKQENLVIQHHREIHKLKGEN